MVGVGVGVGVGGEAVRSCCALLLFRRIITSFILTFSLLSSTHPFNFSPSVQGRLIQEVRHANSNSGSSSMPPPPLQMRGEEEKMRMIGRMGSRPPRCDGKCRNCGHCEAVQVPTTNSVSPPIMRSSVAYARGDGYSDYKPMSWKCKCGQSLFNP